MWMDKGRRGSGGARRNLSLADVVESFAADISALHTASDVTGKHFLAVLEILSCFCNHMSALTHTRHRPLKMAEIIPTYPYSTDPKDLAPRTSTADQQ
jgi:hypothetical protein